MLANVTFDKLCPEYGSEILPGMYYAGCNAWDWVMDGKAVRYTNGTCDNPGQVVEAYKDILDNPDKQYFILFQKVFNSHDNSHSFKWWRWGDYIGTQNPKQLDYLSYEDHIEMIMIFMIYEFVPEVLELTEFENKWDDIWGEWDNGYKSIVKRYVEGCLRLYRNNKIDLRKLHEMIYEYTDEVASVQCIACGSVWNRGDNSHHIEDCELEKTHIPQIKKEMK